MNNQDRGKWTSASNAQADLLCPGRHLAQVNLPEPAKDESAEFGTVVHSALQTSDPSKLSRQQRDIYDSCASILNSKLAEFFGPEVLQMKANPAREKRYWVGWTKQVGEAAVEYRHSAQVDLFYRRGQRGLVVEYKSLAGEVPVSAKNLQVRDQVVCVNANSPLLTSIGAVVIQPLVTHKPEICIYSQDDILLARQQMQVRVEASNNPESERRAGQVQCEFCRARLSCQQHHDWATSGLLVQKTILDTPAEMWTPEQWTAFCYGMGVAQKWLDETKALAKKMLSDNPAAIPGFCLGTGKTNRYVTNPQELFARFEKLGGTLESYMKCVKIGLTLLADEVQVTTGANGKALKVAVEELLKGIIDEVKCELPIVRQKETA